MSPAARALGTTGGLLAAVLATSPASAFTPTLVARFDGELRVSTRLDGFAHEPALSDGLRHVVELGFEVRSTSLPSTVLHRSRRRCAVTYSSWTRDFTVDLTTETTIPAGPVPVSSRLEHAGYEEVDRECRNLTDTSVGSIDGDEPIDVTLVATRDAPSPDTIHRLRRWVVNPDVTSAWIPSYLGLVVQVFVNRLVLRPADDRIVTVRATR